MLEYGRDAPSLQGTFLLALHTPSIVPCRHKFSSRRYSKCSLGTRQETARTTKVIEYVTAYVSADVNDDLRARDYHRGPRPRCVHPLPLQVLRRSQTQKSAR